MAPPTVLSVQYTVFHLGMFAVQIHEGGVDDLSVHVSRSTFPASDWLLGEDPLVQLVSALAPQHPLQTQTPNHTTNLLGSHSGPAAVLRGVSMTTCVWELGWLFSVAGQFSSIG